MKRKKKSNMKNLKPLLKKVKKAIDKINRKV